MRTEINQTQDEAYVDCDSPECSLHFTNGDQCERCGKVVCPKCYVEEEKICCMCWAEAGRLKRIIEAEAQRIRLYELSKLPVDESHNQMSRDAKIMALHIYRQTHRSHIRVIE